MRWLIAACFVAGCTDGGSLIGDENGAFLDAGDEFDVAAEPSDMPPAGIDADDDGLRDSTFTADCLPPDAVVSDPPLQASPDASSVTCVHEGIEAPIDAGWVISGSVESGNHIEMTYDVTNDGDETCLWRLTYTVEGLAPGDWTLAADGETVSFTIAE